MEAEGPGLDTGEDDWCAWEDDGGGTKKSDSGFILKEDPTGFAEGQDTGIREKDELLFGGMSR